MFAKLASDAKVKRRASAPKEGMPVRVVRANVFLDLRLVLAAQQTDGGLRQQRLERDAVDEVDRVERVALGLGHLFALGVAHDGVDVDVPERHLVR